MKKLLILFAIFQGLSLAHAAEVKAPQPEAAGDEEQGDPLAPLTALTVESVSCVRVGAEGVDEKSTLKLSSEVEVKYSEGAKSVAESASGEFEFNPSLLNPSAVSTKAKAVFAKLGSTQDKSVFIAQGAFEMAANSELAKAVREASVSNGVADIKAQVEDIFAESKIKLLDAQVAEIAKSVNESKKPEVYKTLKIGAELTVLSGTEATAKIAEEIEDIALNYELQKDEELKKVMKEGEALGLQEDGKIYVKDKSELPKIRAFQEKMQKTQEAAVAKAHANSKDKLAKAKAFLADKFKGANSIFAVGPYPKLEGKEIKATLAMFICESSVEAKPVVLKKK